MNGNIDDINKDIYLDKEDDKDFSFYIGFLEM